MEVSHMNNWVSLETPSEWRKQAQKLAFDRHQLENKWKKQGKQRVLKPVYSEGFTKTWIEVWE